MTTFKELKDKFDADVAKLQARCPHTESDWFDSMWAPAHFGGNVRVCLACNKRLNYHLYKKRADGVYVPEKKGEE